MYTVHTGDLQNNIDITSEQLKAFYGLDAINKAVKEAK